MPPKKRSAPSPEGEPASKKAKTAEEAADDAAPPKLSAIEERNAERLKQAKKYMMAWAKVRAKSAANKMFSTFKNIGVLDPQKEQEFLEATKQIGWDGPLRQVRRNLKEIVLEREPTVDVDELLGKIGVKNPSSVNFCIKAAIANGHLQLKGEPEELNKVFWSFPCPNGCSKKAKLKMTLEQALNQDETGGCDDDEEDCGVSCENCGYGYYLGGCCRGEPSLHSSKFHNHCTECPNYGVCIYDYRNSHCKFCHTHYFQGNYGFACEGCGRQYNGVMAKDGIGGSDPFGYNSQENIYFQSEEDDDDYDDYDDEERQERLDKVLLAEDYETPEYQAMFDALGSDEDEDEYDDESGDDNIFFGMGHDDESDEDDDEDDEDESEDSDEDGDY